MRLSLLTTFSLLTLSFASPLPTPVQSRNTPLNAFLTILLDYLPDISGAISDVVGLLTDFEALLADLTGEQTTYNQLSASNCAPYTVIFARGTSEPGNVGILVGPPFFDALRGLVGTGSVNVQGVNGYSASVAGYVEGGDPAGSSSMASEIQSAHTLCPNTKLVVSGYSQGGQIVHNAIGLLPASVASWISKVVIFGDPDNGKALPNVAASKVDTYCHAGDNICVNGDLILVPHLTYGENAAAAAAFVVS